MGGLAAAGAAAGIYEDQLNQGSGTETLLTLPGAGVTDGQVLLIEIIATALFLIVISAVATDSRAPGSATVAPLAIGGFIFTAALTMGGLSGARSTRRARSRQRSSLVSSTTSGCTSSVRSWAAP